jgi:hypothetical protein
LLTQDFYFTAPDGKQQIASQTAQDSSFDAYKSGEGTVLSLAEAFKDDYLFGAAERAVSLAVLDDPAPHHFADSRKLCQFFEGCRVQIHAGAAGRGRACSGMIVNGGSRIDVRAFFMARAGDAYNRDEKDRQAMRSQASTGHSLNSQTP